MLHSDTSKCGKQSWENIQVYLCVNNSPRGKHLQHTCTIVQIGRNRYETKAFVRIFKTDSDLNWAKSDKVFILNLVVKAIIKAMESNSENGKSAASCPTEPGGMSGGSESERNKQLQERLKNDPLERLRQSKEKYIKQFAEQDRQYRYVVKWINCYCSFGYDDICSLLGL